MKKKLNGPDMLEEYDFSKGVRGKYAKRYAEGTNVIVVDPDVAQVFPDHDSVNDALRHMAAVIRRQRGPGRRPSRPRRVNLRSRHPRRAPLLGGETR